MRCPHCGFICNNDFDECPYCGYVIKDQNGLLNKRIKLYSNTSIKLTSLINIIIANLFIAILIFDIFFSFKYFLTLGAYLLFALTATIISLISKKKNIISIFERFDFYFITSLILLTTLLPVYFLNNLTFQNIWNISPVLNHINPGTFFAFLIVPIYLLLTSFITIFMLFFARKKKFSPLIAGFILNFHFILSLTLFIILNIANHNEDVAKWALVYISTLGDALTILEEVVVSFAFILNILIFINFNTLIIRSIISHSKIIYGHDKED